MESVRRKLASRVRYRGALVFVSLAYGTEAALLHFSRTVTTFGPRGWLFALAALAGLWCAWRPRHAWARHLSAIAAVTAPAGRALELILGDTVLPGVVEEWVAVVAWGLVAALAFLVWPLILPPHIDVGHFAQGLGEGDGD